jgi:hypothetical protein
MQPEALQRPAFASIEPKVDPGEEKILNYDGRK